MQKWSKMKARASFFKVTVKKHRGPWRCQQPGITGVRSLASDRNAVKRRSPKKNCIAKKLNDKLSEQENKDLSVDKRMCGQNC